MFELLGITLFVAVVAFLGWAFHNPRWDGE